MMFDMRLRVRELMHKQGWSTAYALAMGSGGRIPLTTAQRLVSSDGRPKRIDFATIEALCDVLRVSPGQLFDDEKANKR